MSDTCRPFSPFGDPWPSCPLPSQKCLWSSDIRASLVAQRVSDTMWKTWVQFLGWEDVLEEGTATWRRASLVAQMVSDAMWKTWVWFLGWEDLLEEGTATHSSILAWRIPWTVEHGRQAIVHGVARTWLSHCHLLSFFFFNLVTGLVTENLVIWIFSLLENMIPVSYHNSHWLNLNTFLKMEYHLSHYFFIYGPTKSKKATMYFIFMSPWNGLMFKAALKSVESVLRNVS